MKEITLFLALPTLVIIGVGFILCLIDMKRDFVWQDRFNLLGTVSIIGAVLSLANMVAYGIVGDYLVTGIWIFSLFMWLISVFSAFD